jgi:hypothetical protein
MKLLKDIALDISASSWTWLGMLIAWIVLPDGSTRDFVGVCILVLLGLWAATGPLRWNKE